MSQLKFTVPIRLGLFTVDTQVYECNDGYETYYEVRFPGLGRDLIYTLRLAYDGSVNFFFDRYTPDDIRAHEQLYSDAIFDYYFFEGLTKDYVL